MTVREANLTAASSADRETEIIESGGTARLHLTLAITDYDHVRDLVNGVVRAEGIVLTAFVLPVEEIFYRFIKNREWDISEMSFGKFIGYASQGNSPFVGIPVFPSRVFRHSAFYVRTDRGISDRRIWKASAWEFRNGRKPPASMRGDFYRKRLAWICGRSNGCRRA